ncbi:MAG: DUF5717 family protein, partial [Anaerolineae bacterium]
ALSPATFSGTQATIRVATTGLATKQQHTGTLELISNGGAGRIEVSVYVDEPPRLAVNPQALDFGSLAAVDQRTLVLAISNIGGQKLQGTLAGVPIWLSASSLVFDGNQKDLRLTVKGIDLPATGQNVATIVLNSNGGNTAVHVVATAPAPQLLIQPSTLDFGALAAAEQKTSTLVLSNAGGRLLQGSVTGASSWLHVSATTFAGQHTELACMVIGGDLPAAGPNSTTLSITSNGGTATVGVNAIAQPTTLIVTPAGLDLGHQARGRRIQRTLAISNPGFGILAGTVAASESWLTVEPAAFVGNQVSIALLTDTEQLTPAGEYRAAVKVQSNGGEADIPAIVKVSAYRGLAHTVRHSRLFMASAAMVVVLLLCIGLSIGTAMLLPGLDSPTPLPGRARSPTADVVTRSPVPVPAGGSVHKTSTATMTPTATVNLVSTHSVIKRTVTITGTATVTVTTTQTATLPVTVAGGLPSATATKSAQSR